MEGVCRLPSRHSAARRFHVCTVLTRPSRSSRSSGSISCAGLCLLLVRRLTTTLLVSTLFGYCVLDGAHCYLCAGVARPPPEEARRTLLLPPAFCQFLVWVGPFFGFSHSRLYFSWILLSRPLLVLSLYWAALVLVYGCNCRRRVSATRIEVLEDWHLRQFPRCRFLYWLCCDRVCLNKSCHIHSRYGFIVINCRSSCWHVCHVVTAYALHIDARDLFACSSKE